MIYLIGGSPRSGKTILSKKLSQDLGIPYLSTDTLRLFMVACLDDEDKYSYFPFEKMFDSTAIDSFYKKYSGDSILKADVEEAKNLMPGIVAFIKYFQSSNSDYILEGVHFLPELISGLQEDEGIKTVILSKKDSDKIYEGLIENRGNNDWIADNIQDDGTLLAAAKSLSLYGEYFETEAAKYNIAHINTEDSFFDKIEEALTYLK